MIRFADFQRDYAALEGLEGAVDRMNQFVAAQGVKVISVESLTDGPSGNTPTSIGLIGVRLWYFDAP